MKRRTLIFLLAAGAPWAVLHTRAADDARSLFTGLWVQQDSGGVLEFRGDGKIVGHPAGGSFKFGEKDWIEITSGGEKLDCRWKKKSDDEIDLTRFIEGKEDTTQLLRLKPVALDLKAWTGRYFVRHLVANGKQATGRAVRLEESGHFRTKEGGYYLRLVEAKNGGILAYASGEEDQTINVQVFRAGKYLVTFNRLDDPKLFASCLKID